MWCSVVICLMLSTTEAHSSWNNRGTTWPQQVVLDRNESFSYETPINSPKVPVLSYNYESGSHRQRHHSSSPWRERKSSYYRMPPIADIESPQEGGPSITAARKRLPTTGVYRTYGRGQAVIPYKGATVNVPRTFGSARAHKAVISTRIYTPNQDPEAVSNGVISRSRRDCSHCPQDEVVFASRGNSYVILPQPCAHRWQTLTGPKPGSKLAEGVYYITGTLGHKRHFCQYRYDVKVRHCPVMADEQVTATCSADNNWGSKCNFTCPSGTKIQGTIHSECGDDLRWTAPFPTCSESYDCDIPDLESGMKFNCHANEVTENSFPEGTVCRIKSKDMDTTVRCTRADWIVKSRKHRGRKKKREKKGGICVSNPCHNGGTCLVSKRNDPPFLCLCAPGVEGSRCEYKQCKQNPCLNGGRCLSILGETTCFCYSGHTGTFCEQSNNNLDS